MASQFNNLIQSKSIASINPQQILAAGSPVFFDVLTSADIAAINRLIQAYSRIHAPTYGQPIPLSGSVDSGVGAKTILAPSATEIRKVMAVDFTNEGANPITGTITLGGVVLLPFAANPASTTSAALKDGIYCSNNLQLAITVDSGTASDLTTSCASVLVVQ